MCSNSESLGTHDRVMWFLSKSGNLIETWRFSHDIIGQNNSQNTYSLPKCVISAHNLTVYLISSTPLTRHQRNPHAISVDRRHFIRITIVGVGHNMCLVIAAICVLRYADDATRHTYLFLPNRWNDWANAQAPMIRQSSDMQTVLNHKCTNFIWVKCWHFYWITHSPPRERRVQITLLFMSSKPPRSIFN